VTERQTLHLVHRDHRRTYEDNTYVYPVVSRRSHGVSIGINLNPDKICNFDCVYCQVDRSTPGPRKDVDRFLLRSEVEEMLERVTSGTLFESERFQGTPEPLRRLNDIAFSGDGEPTTCPEFADIVADVADVKRQARLDAVKLVLITNATMFHRPNVQRGLEVLHANNGEVWAKLDAGTDTYYHLIERTTIPLARVLENIALAACRHALVIQSLFLRWQGVGPDEAEREAYCARLNEIQRAGGRIKLVQVYTIARRPAESEATPLSVAEVDALVSLVHRRTGLMAEPFYGPSGS